MMIVDLGRGLFFADKFSIMNAKQESAGIHMIQKVRRYIREHQLLKQGDRIAAGVSGGADSVCLLLCLEALREEWELDLQVVHVHHGLRGEEADRDAEFVRELCRSHDISFALYREDVASQAHRLGLSVEEAGRELRYKLLREEADGGKIAVAHHQDDQSETLLWNLVRGTGLRGMGGMLPAYNEIVRPLLACTRKEIEEYLTLCGQEYRVDATNQENIYTRNKIRNHVIPYLERELNSQASRHIAAFAEQAAEADQYLDVVAAEVFADISRQAGNQILLPLEPLCIQPPVIGRRILRFAWEQLAGSCRELTSAHLHAIWKLRDKPVGSQLDLPHRIQARRDYQVLSIGPVQENPLQPVLPKLREEILSYEKGKKIPENRYTKWFDYDKIENTAILRYRQTGDYLELAGTGRKTVKSYMIDAKIPASLRGRIPLLADGNHVMWIVGYRISEAYKVTKDTKHIYQVTVGGEMDE